VTGQRRSGLGAHEPMMDIKLGETGGPPAETIIAEVNVNPWLDRAARAAIVIVFTALAFVSLVGIPPLFPPDSIHKLLMVAARIANVMFLSLIASRLLVLLKPIWLRSANFRSWQHEAKGVSQGLSQRMRPLSFYCNLYGCHHALRRNSRGECEVV
jgi:hypothetical protein